MLLLKHTFVHGHFLQLTYGFHHQFEHCILGTDIAGTVVHTSAQKWIQRQKLRKTIKGANFLHSVLKAFDMHAFFQKRLSLKVPFNIDQHLFKMFPLRRQKFFYFACTLLENTSVSPQFTVIKGILCYI